MTEPLPGINLGGWLVLEKWMTPELFAGTEAVDEYQFCQLASATQKLKTFRDSFITEKDFARLAQQDIQLVRLPVGYWLFGDVAPYAATVNYVDNAFRWAQKHGLKVLLDLHGAPGSQNGEDHSGQVGEIGWCSPQAAEYANQTLRVLARLGERYGQHPALWGIELLNEPSSKIPTRLLNSFYRRGYRLVSGLCTPEVVVVAHDAFRPWRWFLRLPRCCYPRLIIDHHHYQIFTDRDKHLTARQQIRRAQRWLPWQARLFSLFHSLVIGEWSGSLARPTTDEEFAAYVVAQRRAFRMTVGYCYWSYKTSEGGSWSFKDHALVVHSRDSQ